MKLNLLLLRFLQTFGVPVVKRAVVALVQALWITQRRGDPSSGRRKVANREFRW